jgi:hypothetical protein
MQRMSDQRRSECSALYSKLTHPQRRPADDRGAADEQARGQNGDGKKRVRESVF